MNDLPAVLNGLMAIAERYEPKQAAVYAALLRRIEEDSRLRKSKPETSCASA